MLPKKKVVTKKMFFFNINFLCPISGRETVYYRVGVVGSSTNQQVLYFVLYTVQGPKLRKSFHALRGLTCLCLKPNLPNKEIM